MSVPKKDLEREIEEEEDEESSLPETEETGAAAAGDHLDDSLAAGRDAILRYAKLAPSQPGRLPHDRCAGRCALRRQGEERPEARSRLCRPTGLDTRIERMIAATRALEFVVTRTETEALLLERT